MNLATRQPQQTTQRILRAAEIAFAELGFDGTGMKAIAQRADVSQGLLHYHFGTKDHLYSEVVRHRSQLINSEREAMLSRIDTSAPDAIEKILAALFEPPLGPAGGDDAYARIFGGLIVGRARERALVQELYDPTARRFIAALQEAMPGSDQLSAAQCYTFALGGLVSVISRDGRLQRLSGRETVLEEDEPPLEAVIRFCAAGIRGMAATPPAS